MISFVKYLWNSWGNEEKVKQELQQKLEEELRYLDEKFEENEDKTLEEATLSIQGNSVVNGSSLNSESTPTCFKSLGVITKLNSDNGTIDNSIFFDINEAALAIACELKVGSHIEYLAYRQPLTDQLKVVKITRINDQYWDSEVPGPEQLDREIESLRKEQPTYFQTQQRNILGIIVERKKDSVLIDTDYKTLNVELDNVTMDFIPFEGDRVFIVCNVQTDEHFVDKHGEILQVLSINPSRLMKDEKRVVERVMPQWITLSGEAILMHDTMPSLCAKLQPKDTVLVDLIECERGDFAWRAISVSIQQRSEVSTVQPPSQKDSLTMPLTQRNDNNQDYHTVTVPETASIVISGLDQTQKLEIPIKNNRPKAVLVQSVSLRNQRFGSQVKLLDPPPNRPFDLPPRGTKMIVLEITSKNLGETIETLFIRFEKFQLKRSFKLTVCEGDEEVQAASENTEGVSKFQRHQRSREYANQVWTHRHRAEVVPGVRHAPSRRFIKVRIDAFDVPDRLRRAYLSCDAEQFCDDSIRNMFPCLKDTLNFQNYAQRFQTLLHLEELDCFINFRKYDRERAHFEREGEYLALRVENLAEQRPSLVIGDSVRAYNPWSDEPEDKSAMGYEGTIYKVLFDRVLFKFHPSFQGKYNGEDYRLEFHFSRFIYRKQHFVTQRMVKHLGSQFLFPTKIALRESVQLEAELVQDDELLIQGKSMKWFNPLLNTVQKRAIRNVLRGEAYKMPYIIFGPPGTGKTLTVVETILQLVHNVSSARILVGTPSNSSADLICTRLIESGALKPGEFVRLVSTNLVEKELIPEHLTAYCATCDFAAEGTAENTMITTESGLKLRCQMKYLGAHRVTISTCMTLGNFLPMGFPKDHFTHVIIDECGQCKEPEVMIPISLVSARFGQVILAGDPQQLQPMVLNSQAKRFGLSLSYLERILQFTPYRKDVIRFGETNGFDPRLVTKLLYNYRALPSILKAYNDLFYDSELLAEVCPKDSREAKLLASLTALLPDAYQNQRAESHGMYFVGVRGENKQESDSPSWYNPMEAKYVFMTVIKLYRLNIPASSIGIITPYAKQVKHIRSLFIAADIALPKIGTVEEFQGQERDVILISTVRSKAHLIQSDVRMHLGFVQCSKRMNVAISRARTLNIIFGNPHLLVLDENWRTLIKYCLDNEAYTGCDIPETLDDNDDTTSDAKHDGEPNGRSE